MNISDEDKTLYVQIWAKAVDTQMHFNEMSVRSRQLGLAFVTAILGVGIVLLSRGDEFAFPVQVWRLKFDAHVSIFLVFAAAFAVWGVSMLDLRVYHKMLRGAVSFGEDFEENYLKKVVPLDKGMTQAISHFSRHDDASVKKKADGTFSYEGTNEITAATKIRRVYRLIVGALMMVAIILIVFTGNFAIVPSIAAGIE